MLYNLLNKLHETVMLNKIPRNFLGRRKSADIVITENRSTRSNTRT